MDQPRSRSAAAAQLDRRAGPFFRGVRSRAMHCAIRARGLLLHPCADACRGHPVWAVPGAATRAARPRRRASGSVSRLDRRRTARHAPRAAQHAGWLRGLNVQIPLIDIHKNLSFDIGLRGHYRGRLPSRRKNRCPKSRCRCPSRIYPRNGHQHRSPRPKRARCTSTPATLSTCSCRPSRTKASPPSLRKRCIAIRPRA